MDKLLSCVIIEDQVPAQRILKTYIDDLGTLNLRAVFTNGIEALEFLKAEPIDILFLDIHLPKISGIDFLQILPTKPHVILTTAFSDYALDGYELDVIDYLLKPFSFQRFVKAVTKVGAVSNIKSTYEITEINEQEHLDYVFVKIGSDHIKVRYSNIDYIKSDSDYTTIFTKTKKHLVSITLTEWNERLQNKPFCQVHKSYIVNVNAISKLSGNRITMEDGTTVPVGRSYKEVFVKRYVRI